MGNSSYFRFDDDDDKTKYIFYDGFMDIHDCCELWISMIIIDIHNLIIDNSVMDICNRIMGYISEDLMV